MTKPDYLDSMTISILQQSYTNRTLLPTQLFEQIIKRLQSTDQNIWLSKFDDSQLMESANQAERELLSEPDILTKKPLLGIPFAVKDNIDVVGLPTTAGCTASAFFPKQHAFVVKKLLDAGAIIIGKTNMDQFATGLVGIRTNKDFPNNPFNKNYIPGGSSSGSAVAVASGLASFALGTDTAGSGRVPAALNNLVGFKPTKGMFSNSGVFPACKSLDCVSIFSHTLQDAVTVANLLQAFDVNDIFSRKNKSHSSKVNTLKANNCVIAIPQSRDLSFFGNTESASLYKNCVDVMQQRGITIKPIDFSPFIAAAKLLYDGPWVTERQLAFGNNAEQYPKDIHPDVLAAINCHGKYSAADAFIGLYELKKIKRQVEAIFETANCLLVPTIGSPFTVEEAKDPGKLVNTKLGYYTNFVNLLDLCAIAVPAGFHTSNVPFGITFIGPAWSENQLVEISELFLQNPHHNSPTSHSLTVNNGSENDSVTIAVAGGHMSGLPLNYQLVDNGGQFVRTTRTSSNYQLYHLAGFTPPRPGLVQVENGTSIEVEIWKLPKDRLGWFVSMIPKPLSIGSVELMDGSTTLGFLCEAHATKNASNISQFGGWRYYLKQRTT